MDPALAQRKFRQFSIGRIIFQHQYMDVTLHERPDNYTIPGVRTLNRVKDPQESVTGDEWRVTGRETKEDLAAYCRKKFDIRRSDSMCLNSGFQEFGIASDFGFRTSSFTSPWMTRPKFSKIVIFCQILREKPAVRSSTSSTASSKTGSWKSWT